jgi:hypothetical protein
MSMSSTCPTNSRPWTPSTVSTGTHRVETKAGGAKLVEHDG